MTESSDLLRVCGVYENVSKSGDQYFSAYLGGIKLLLLRKKRAGENEPPWTLFFCARPEKKAASVEQPTAQQSYPEHIGPAAGEGSDRSGDI
jgi:hypothetical protein